VLHLPDVDLARDFLDGCDNPTVRMWLALLDDPDADVVRFQAAVAESSPILAALEIQRADGSWGDHNRPLNRLLPTLWMVKTLQELGIPRDCEPWRRGVEFLANVGHTEEGVFSISSRRDGVLSCYVGIMALLYRNGGFDDHARVQLEWIRRHQEVRVAGSDRRNTPAVPWGAHLRTKYGGCMADTTCLVGLLRTARALVAAGHVADPLVAETRRAFLDRRLIFSSRGTVIPLAVSAAKAEAWLAPTFPLDWRVDLIEVLDFVAHTGPPDDRMQDAIDRLVDFRRDDGTWPLLRAYPPSGLGGLERPSSRRPSAMATMRAVAALSALDAAA
jgi:hypothetical protein